MTQDKAQRKIEDLMDAIGPIEVLKRLESSRPSDAETGSAGEIFARELEAFCKKHGATMTINEWFEKDGTAYFGVKMDWKPNS